MTALLKAVLAVVLAGAGVGKLTDREGSREEVIAFGVPAALARPVAFALPLLEIVLAVAIVVPATGRWGALGALVLLLAYTAAIAVNLALGRRPDCKCFGPILVVPIGWRALLRNVVLAATAALLLARLS